MATYCGGETTSDLFSEINPAYVSLVHSAMKRFAGMSLAFAKVVEATWRETFCFLPGALDQQFVRTLFPSFLRKTKNLLTIVQPISVGDVPESLPVNKCYPISAKPSDRLYCSFSTFVELLSTFIDSIFTALDGNLLTDAVLSDLSSKEQPEYHVISYCLYSARLCANLPIQHVEFVEIWCHEMRSLLHSALNSPTFENFRNLADISVNSPTSKLARSFVEAFEILISASLNLKSKNSHLTELGKMRESYLATGRNFAFSDIEDPVAAGSSCRFRTSSLPNSALRNIVRVGAKTNALTLSSSRRDSGITSLIDENRIDEEPTSGVNILSLDNVPSVHSVSSTEDSVNCNSTEQDGTKSKHKFDDAIQAIEDNLAQCETQLTIFRKELLTESNKREGLEREVVSLNNFVKFQVQEKPLNRFSDGPQVTEYFTASSSPINELRGRIEQLLNWTKQLAENENNRNNGSDQETNEINVTCRRNSMTQTKKSTGSGEPADRYIWVQYAPVGHTINCNCQPELK